MVYLSIIIPHYNSALSLKKLLNTIPNKKDIQVIIIDDYSDEKNKRELLEIAVEYKDTNVEIYHNSKKKGAGTCRNIGLERARGKWLLFADSDDLFLDNFFYKVNKYFESIYDVIFFKPTSIDLVTGSITQRHIRYEELINEYINKKKRKSELSLRYNFFVPWSKLIKASLVKENKILFDEVLVSNDVMFSTKVGYYLKDFYVSEEVIYCVTRREGSLTTTIDQRLFDIRLNVFINYCNYLKEKLDKKDFKELNINGTGYIMKASAFGINKMNNVFLKLRANNISIVNKNIFNPNKLVKKIVKKV